MSVNQVFLVGRIGAAPERRVTSSGKPLCTMRVATDRYDKAQGSKTSDWHTVVVWDRDAENCLRYLTAGSQVAVEGRINHRQYADKEGQPRYWTEVVAHRVTFLGGRSDRPAEPGRGPGEERQAPASHDDIPF